MAVGGSSHFTPFPILSLAPTLALALALLHAYFNATFLPVRMDS